MKDSELYELLVTSSTIKLFDEYAPDEEVLAKMIQGYSKRLYKDYSKIAELFPEPESPNFDQCLQIAKRIRYDKL